MPLHIVPTCGVIDQATELLLPPFINAVNDAIWFADNEMKPGLRDNELCEEEPDVKVGVEATPGINEITAVPIWLLPKLVAITATVWGALISLGAT